MKTNKRRIHSLNFSARSANSNSYYYELAIVSKTWFNDHHMEIFIPHGTVSLMMGKDKTAVRIGGVLISYAVKELFKETTL